MAPGPNTVPIFRRNSAVRATNGFENSFIGQCPGPKEGGASLGVAPQFRSGDFDILKSSEPPCSAKLSSSHGFVLATPFTFSAKMNGAAGALPVERITMTPPGREMV